MDEKALVWVFLSLGPWALGAAAPSQNQAVRPVIRELDAHGARYSSDLLVELVNPYDEAAKHRATIQVYVEHLKLEPRGSRRPSNVDETPQTSAYLRYQIDDELPIETTRTHMTFRNLREGRHEVRVWLVAMNNVPLTEEDLEVLTD